MSYGNRERCARNQWREPKPGKRTVFTKRKQQKPCAGKWSTVSKNCFQMTRSNSWIVANFLIIYIASSHSPEQSISPTHLMIPSSTLLLLRVPGVAYGHTTAVPKRGRTMFFFNKPSGQDDWYTLSTPDGWTSTITKLLYSLEVRKPFNKWSFR